MTTVATVCARGGSKGVPGKNIRPMLGRPLITYTISQAQSAPSIDHVYVSTDSAEVAEIARNAGATVLGLRPAELARDDTPKLPVIEHLVAQIEDSGVTVDRIVDLDPTSPLREVDDIEACIAKLTPDSDVVITGYRSDKNPYFNMVEEKQPGEYGLVCPPTTAFAGRQSAPAVFAMNASIYCWHRSTLNKGLWEGTVRFHEMERTRSIDIDHELDWQLVELILRERETGAPQ